MLVPCHTAPSLPPSLCLSLSGRAVTFVALGNGVPDLSSNIAAISSGQVLLSAGALTGSAMFVQCIVASELLALAGPSGIKCGGAMLRDVGVYTMAISSVLITFSLGYVRHDAAVAGGGGGGGRGRCKCVCVWGGCCCAPGRWQLLLPLPRKEAPTHLLLPPLPSRVT